MGKGVIIQASSRSNGNTSKIVKRFTTYTDFEVIDLNTYKINHFDYDFKNKEDDFNALFKKIVTEYETIVFATPIYWYTMSGICKVFLDRISDFLFHEKDFGRMLRGKSMAVISCGSDSEVFEGFDMPFKESANYLGMHYLGHLHTWVDKGGISKIVKEKLDQFLDITTKHIN